jgi:hypothetical protein
MEFASSTARLFRDQLLMAVAAAAVLTGGRAVQASQPAAIDVAIAQGDARDCPCTTLWPPSAVPTVLDTQDPNPAELGINFRSDVDAQIAGLRFYKSSRNTGTHVGHIWTSDGRLLAAATFTNETAAGWQQVMFSAPVAITANTTYVASYHTNVGHYSITKGYFDGLAVDAPPLHAPSSVAGSGNGVLGDGVSAFPTTTYQAANYWVDVVLHRPLVDVTPPALNSIDANAIDSFTTRAEWTTDEDATSLVEYSTSAAFPGGAQLNVADRTLTTSHGLTLSGLTASTTYYYRVTSVDGSGNASTSDPNRFTTPSPTFRDTLSSHFAAGTTAGTYVAEDLDGEVMLAPAVGSEFSGTALQPGWSDVPWGDAGAGTLGGGRLVVDGTLVGACTIVRDRCRETPAYLPGRSLEFMATFTDDVFQNVGFGATFETSPWAVFSTRGGGSLWTRTSVVRPITVMETQLSSALIGSPHLYRIDWNLTAIVYWVDGVQVASHPMVVPGPMRPLMSDYNVYGGGVVIDWMRMGPYMASGTFTSRVFDAQTSVDWRSIDWSGSASGLTVSLRMGETPTPDDRTWTDFDPVVEGSIRGRSRYIQYRAGFVATNGHTPVLADIIITSATATMTFDNAASAANDARDPIPASGLGQAKIQR